MSLETDSRSTSDALADLQARARYAFDIAEFGALAGRQNNAHSIRMTLKRLEERGHVTIVHKRPTVCIIVPPEYRAYGAPPLSWWLHDAMQLIEPVYYVALNSAARYWGSSHYAIQSDQVMVGCSRAPITVGRQQLVFTARSNIECAPTVRTRDDRGAYLVSTREATLLDLTRHRSKVGGLETIARVARDFAPHLDQSELVRALNSMGQVAVAQRLGFVLERLALNRMSSAVEKWLSPRVRATRLLAGPLPEAESSFPNPRWSITYCARDIREIDEAR